jgi:DNA (cytosine-5)-methyltransferase 1
VDNSKKLGHVGLCAGYGGIDIGLSRAIGNLRTIAFSEIEAYACANLVSKMEAGLLDCAPVWTNLKTFPWKEFRDRIYLLSGGYPCQPFSTAGRRLGTEDPRHLWPFIREGIKTARPVWCFFENVDGHLSLGFREVQQSLRRLGYRVEAGIFSASEVGAPHRRKRLFILAKRESCGHGRRSDPHGVDGIRFQKLPQDERSVLWSEVTGCSGDIRRKLANNIGQRVEEQHGQKPTKKEYSTARDCSTAELGNSEHNGSHRPEITGSAEASSNDHTQRQDATSEPERAGRPRVVRNIWPSRPGQPQYEWEPPRVVANGNGDRLDQRRERKPAFGSNGVVREIRWQAKSPLGRIVNGAADRLDYSELCVSGDNRTDELRLLGNGVVPETVTKAFLTLLAKFE